MKRIIAIICALLLLVLLIPQRHNVNDGGTVIYEAAVYTVYNMHQIASVGPADENGKHPTTYIDGIIVEILGYEVYNNTYITD